ncbi:MAG: UDP-3-O-acyl-N-acetylglucosamine deacetylase [Pseudomonadota bacterium]
MSRRFVGGRQTTIAREVELNGTGVHSGAPVSIVLHPASVDTGVRFLVSRRGRVVADIPAHVDRVKNLTLCTVLGDDAGNTVGTVEHLMAALRGLGVDNCLVEIDGREVPIMDGSSSVFVDAIDAVGLKQQTKARKFLKVLRPVIVDEGGCYGELTPHNGFKLDVEIKFPTDVIGRQRMKLELSPSAFRNELSEARTFGFMSDVEKLWKSGLALGASLSNSVGIGDDGVLNEDGLRFPNEFVRHKALDAVGDLSLAGLPILGAFRSICGGHRLNATVLQALFADRSAYEVVDGVDLTVQPASERVRSVPTVPASLTALAGE